MKREVKVVLGLAVVVVVFDLFLLPVVPITVSAGCETSATINFGPCVAIPASGSASVMYAYFGAGAVQVPVSSGHSYCLMYGNPGTMCRLAMQRMNQMIAP